MNDIVQRLREYCSVDKGADPIMLKVLSVVRPDLSDAADLIEALEAEVAALKSQLHEAREDEKAAGKAYDEVLLTKDVMRDALQAAEAEVERLKGELTFVQGQLAGTNKNIAGWLEARDDNLKRAEAAEAEVAALKEDAGWMNIVQGNLRSLLKDMTAECRECNGSGTVWKSLDSADLNEERGSNEPCPKCSIARSALGVKP